MQWLLLFARDCIASFCFFNLDGMEILLGLDCHSIYNPSWLALGIDSTCFDVWLSLGFGFLFGPLGRQICHALLLGVGFGWRLHSGGFERRFEFLGCLI